MNRRGFFGALVGGVAALATGSLLPEKKIKNDLGKNAWDYADFFRPINETERAYIEVDRLERRVQAVTGKTTLVAERLDWLSENCLWIHET